MQPLSPRDRCLLPGGTTLISSPILFHFIRTTHFLCFFNVKAHVLLITGNSKAGSAISHKSLSPYGFLSLEFHSHTIPFLRHFTFTHSIGIVKRFCRIFPTELLLFLYLNLYLSPCFIILIITHPCRIQHSF